MRKLSTLLVVSVFAVGSVLMAGCGGTTEEKKPETTTTSGDTEEVSSSTTDAPEASNLTNVSFEVSGMN